ncbi:MAG: undecaprenyl-diphosphate phosphatase [Candidatus Xenobia bacterium]
MNVIKLIVLALIQGAAELLPVSSSAHVVTAEKLMGLDPSSPAMTFLLVMLHTGTMFAVLLYFWPRWRKLLGEMDAKTFATGLVVATIATGVLGLIFLKVIPKLMHVQDVEDLFGNLTLVSAALLAAGVLIIIAGGSEGGQHPLTPQDAGIIGLVQGLCLPFRGFSRSGATISAGLLLGLPKTLVEDFSFALAVILTPPVVVRELMRLRHAAGSSFHASHELFPGLLGMVFSFIAGYFALKWLSAWLEEGRWRWFGYYCLIAAAVVMLIAHL